MSVLNSAKILGWDVGGTKSAAVVGTAGGDVLDRVQWPSHATRGPEAMITEFLVHARALMERHANVTAVGVSIGGPLNARSGTVLSPPHLPGWDHVPLAEILERELGIAPAVEHDAAACLEAEWLWGGAQGSTHCAYLTCGTGLGAGIMIDGSILRGPDGQSPEVGHIRLAPDGPEMFGKRGCSESFGSGEGIAKLAPFMFPDEFDGPVETRRLFEMHQQGHRHATAVLRESALRTGQLCAILTDFYAPQVILLGSLARYLGPWWVQTVREGFAAEALPINSRHTLIDAACLGERLQDLSAIASCAFGMRTH